jgi:hypothetical protein
VYCARRDLSHMLGARFERSGYEPSGVLKWPVGAQERANERQERVRFGRHLGEISGHVDEPRRDDGIERMIGARCLQRVLLARPARA